MQADPKFEVGQGEQFEDSLNCTMRARHLQDCNFSFESKNRKLDSH